VRLTLFVEAGDLCYTQTENQFYRRKDRSAARDHHATDVLATPRNEWSQKSVEAVMRRTDQLHSVSPDTKLEVAMRLMDEKNIGQVPVMLDGRLVGLIGCDHLIRLIRRRTALFK